MKAERINQDQIRFTLTKDDLSSRNIEVSELAYGSDKTKALFDDMVREAREKFGIDFSARPLMIEAIPISDSTLSVTVTAVSGAAEAGALFGANVPGQNRLPGPERKELPDKTSASSQMPDGLDTAIYVFNSYAALSHAAGLIPEGLTVKNELYADTNRGIYYLMVHYRKISPKVRYFVEIMTQFSNDWFCGTHAQLLVKEHTRLIIRARAIQKLSTIEHAKDAM